MLATTGFWPVKGSLKDVINYAENPDKTTEKRFLDDDLYRTLTYAQNDDKTDQKMYVSTINCPKNDPYGAMMATKKQFGKLGGNVAYHGYQSFKTDEVTPEEAHQIGIETADRMWGNEYQIVVTTHLNTDNVHNHIVLNSVSFKTGRKFENHVSDHYRLRDISDAVCKERGKSVLKNAKFYSGDKKAYWVQQAGKETHRDILRKDIEYCISLSEDRYDFECRMKSLGYTFTRGWSYEEPSVIAPGWKRSVRLSSVGYPMYKLDDLLDKNYYDEEVLFNIRKYPIYYKKQTPLYDLTRTMKRAPWMGALTFPLFLLLELLYLSTVTQEEDKRPVYPLSPELRAEARKLDQYSEDVKLLAKYHIGTSQELFSFQEQMQHQLEELSEERDHIRNQIRRAPEEEKAQLKLDAKEITTKMSPLRKELKIANRIAERSPKVMELLELERQMEQETLEHERIKEWSYER